MKNLCAWLVVVVLLSVAGSCFAFNDEDAEAQSKTCWDVEDKSACFSQVEARVLKRFASKAIRNGPILVVRTKAGSISFENIEFNIYEPNVNSAVDYQYAGFLDVIGYHLLCVSHYESMHYLLISDTSKKQTKMDGIPHISPMLDRAVSVAYNEMSGVENQIRVWKVTPDNLIAEYKYNPLEYALYEYVSWDGNSTILLKNYTSKEEKVRKFCPKSASAVKVNEVLRLVDGKWRLTVATPQDARCDPK